MMYKKGVALSIKKGGEFLREKNSHGERQVFLPFGTEYSIYVKNKNFQRIKIQVRLDGKLTHPDDDWYVVNGNSSLDLKRFMLDGDDNTGEAFKFVDVVGSGEAPGELKNGLVEVTIKEEKAIENKINGRMYPLSRSIDPIMYKMVSHSTTCDSFCDTVSSNYLSSSINVPVSNEGVTVGGSTVEQQFTNVPDFETYSEFKLAVRIKPVKPAKLDGITFTCGERCKCCNGSGTQVDNNGITHYCPECNGKGFHN